MRAIARRQFDHVQVQSFHDDVAHLVTGKAQVGQALINQLLRLSGREGLGDGADGHLAIHCRRQKEPRPAGGYVLLCHTG